jgi:hypothetical protein
MSQTVVVNSVSGGTVVISRSSNTPNPIAVYSTFALLESNIANLVEGQVYYVQDDDGVPNWFGFDGTNIHWIVSQQVTNF